MCCLIHFAPIVTFTYLVKVTVLRLSHTCVFSKQDGGKEAGDFEDLDQLLEDAKNRKEQEV